MDYTLTVPNHGDLECAHRRCCFGMNRPLLSRYHPLHALPLDLLEVENRGLVRSDDPIPE